jgi:hypothetical protein
MATILKIKLRDRRALIGVLALGAAACLTVYTSPSSLAQTGVPWTLGRIEQGFVWAPRANVVPAIDACDSKLPNAQPTWTGSSYDLPPPVCLLRTMRAGGASSKAMAFARWYHAFSEGDGAFIVSVRKPRFGVVSIAEIELPGRADNN